LGLYEGAIVPGITNMILSYEVDPNFLKREIPRTDLLSMMIKNDLPSITSFCTAFLM
jgi:hypothetical protein